MSTPTLDATLLTTRFVSSWLSRARPGDMFDPDPTRRAAAWAHWALTAMSAMTGHGDRPYTALRLPGRFYDRLSAGTVRTPHLEIPASMFDRPDGQFPDRLAQAGNALMFPWWVVPEVLAVKRGVLSPAGGDVSGIVDIFNDNRAALVDALGTLSRAAADAWAVADELLAEDPGTLSATATRPFSSREVADFLPAVGDLKLQITSDRKLAETAKTRASRRLGVWCIEGVGSEPFRLGVLTPRLTRSSLFGDPLFAPDREAPAALLVRGLLLRRLLSTHLGVDVAQHVAAAQAGHGPSSRLRAVVARVGEKLPEASTASATHFLRTYPDPDQAWAALESWAAAPPGTGVASRRATLTVTADAFHTAHRAALQALDRAEDPVRDDINVVLPVAWDHLNRVVRVTFARPAASPPER